MSGKDPQVIMVKQTKQNKKIISALRHEIHFQFVFLIFLIPRSPHYKSCYIQSYMESIY